MRRIWRRSVSTDSDFAPVGPVGETVTVLVDGAPVAMTLGDSLAAGLLAAGLRAFRETPVSGAPRGPFCMMGACFDCLVEIDGETVQACMTPVATGLVVSRPRRERADG
jgi:predicted molibdopterin-dependent oxidoreductase YjgC